VTGSVADPAENDYVYDGGSNTLGNATAITRKCLGTNHCASDLTSTFAFAGPYNQLHTTTDPGGNVTTYTYDSNYAYVTGIQYLLLRRTE